MNVLITGGSRGIGRAIGEQLAGSHDLAIGYRTSGEAAASVAATAGEAGSETAIVQGDVGDPDSAERLVADAAAALGGLDAVVNSAGIVDPARLDEITNEQWERVLRTNLHGAFYVSRAAIEYLIPGGDLVFVSSIGGTAGTVDASYAASKAGLHGLTRAIAREFGEDGVTSNAIAPGPVETEMNDEIVEYLEGIAFRGHENIDTHVPAYACTPETVAEAVAWMLDTDYLQGEVINLNGGMQFR